MPLPHYTNVRSAIVFGSGIVPNHEPIYTNNKKGTLPRELASDYKEVKQKIYSLKKELKKYRIMLDMLENNPERYLNLKNIDPFNEENWDD